MVKIIFSGTYDGFSTWYDSDRNYSRRGTNDPVAKHLFDRGQYLYKGDSRLYRKGYSIQPVCSEDAVGILFHKIMLLSDAFGRGQGFMTASMFLPKDEWLDGCVIRKALDELVGHYEMLIDKGQAVVEIDWSFVDRKAEELRRIVDEQGKKEWHMLPSKSDKGPALLRGLEPDDVNIYFTYPNPLFGIFPRYEQVFLTEELLGAETSGYEVILKEDVDPTNPTISILRPLDYNVLEWKGETMKKKALEAELAANGGQIRWGKVSKRGCREGDVWLTNEDVKNLDDRYEIRLSSPMLNMMEATVTLQLMEKDKVLDEGKTSGFTFEWSSVTSKPPKQEGMTFRFEGEQCENKEWTLKVGGKPEYKVSEETIMVSDRISPVITVILERKKVIGITVSTPEAYKGMVNVEYKVYEDEKDSQIAKIREKFEKFKDELQVVVRDEGGDKVLIEVKERPKPIVWTIQAVNEDAVNSDVKTTKYEGDDEIELNKKVNQFIEDLKKELWEVKQKDGKKDILYKSDKKQVILKVVRMPEPPIVAPPLDPTSETVQSDTVTTPIHPSNGTPTASTTITIPDNKPVEETPKEEFKTFYIRLDNASKDFPLFNNGTNVVEADGAGADSVVYDSRRHCLIWKGCSSECPNPSKLRLKEYGKYRYEFDNSSELQWSETQKGIRFKVKQNTKEKAQTYYIPLAGDGLPNFPLFMNYVTPEEALIVIGELLKKAKRLGEKDNNRTKALRVVEELGVVENQDNGEVSFDGDVNFQLAKDDAETITDENLRKLANKAIDKRKKSFVVEGDDSVRYDKKLYCLTWKGLLSQRPEPNKLKFKEYTRHGYEFANDTEHPLQWEDTPDTPDGHRYKVNKIIEKKDIYWLIEWIRKHWWKFAIGVVGVGAVAGIVYVAVNWSSIKGNLPSLTNPISILPSCGREKQPDPHTVAVFGDVLINEKNALVKNYSGNTSYVGDDAFEKIEAIYNQCRNAINNNQNRLKNADTIGFHDLEILYKKQGEYQTCESNYKKFCQTLLNKDDWNDCDSVQWFKLQNDQDWLGTHDNQSCGVSARQVSTEWKEHAMLATIQKIEERFSERPKPQEEGEETVQNTEDDADIKETALAENNKRWKEYKTKTPCVYNCDFYYLKKMKSFISEVEESKRDVVLKALIESGNIVEAVKEMDAMYIPAYATFFSSDSNFAYFYDKLDTDTQELYKKHLGTTSSSPTSGASSTSGTSSSSSRTSSTSRATTPSIVTPSQNGQNEQGQGNVGTGSGTDGNTKAGTETQPQKEKIEVKNIEDLWGACNKLEHVMSYDDYIKFRCSTDFLRLNLISKINSIKNVINDNNKNSYVGLYNRVNRENIIVVKKFDKLIEELQSLNNTK